ncbi:MAG: hypothetical protein ACOYPS_03650 [Phycisphaerales bacterium]|jgi:hypothetical protein
MTLLQTTLDAPAPTIAPARPVRLRFHEAPASPPPAPGRSASTFSPAKRRLWSLSASSAALDLALDRMIDEAARDLRAAR